MLDATLGELDRLVGVAFQGAFAPPSHRGNSAKGSSAAGLLRSSADLQAAVHLHEVVTAAVALARARVVAAEVEAIETIRHAFAQVRRTRPSWALSTSRRVSSRSAPRLRPDDAVVDQVVHAKAALVVVLMDRKRVAINLRAVREEEAALGRLAGAAVEDPEAHRRALKQAEARVAYWSRQDSSMSAIAELLKAGWRELMGTLSPELAARVAATPIEALIEQASRAARAAAPIATAGERPVATLAARRAGRSSR